jgi:hypothetical protein
MRRAAAVTTLLFGLFVLSLPLVFSLFSRTSASEHVTDSFRTTLSAQGVTALKADYATIRGLGTELVGGLRPQLARQLGMTQPQFDRFTARNFPAVAEAVKVVPPAIALVDPVVPQLERVQSSGDFRKVDAIPGLGLSLKVVPWLLVAIGLVAVGIGITGIARPSRGTVWAGFVLGAATVIAAFALNLPAKFQAAHRIVAVGRVALSQKAADTATQTVAVVDATVKEVETKMVPALAARFGLPPGKLVAAIGRKYPGITKGLRDWPRIKPGAAALAAQQRANVHELARGDGVPFRTLPWLLIGSALILTLVAGVALIRRPVAA